MLRSLILVVFLLPVFHDGVAIAQEQVATPVVQSERIAEIDDAIPDGIPPTSNWWQQDIWKDPNRGFYWYPPAHPMKKEEKKKAESPVKPKTIYEMTNSEDVHKELNKMLDTAIFNPTEKNVYEYQKAKLWVLDKSSTFADVARRVTWQNPDIDYNTRAPFASFAQDARNNQNYTKRHDVLEKLGNNYGVLFFFKSDCPYCHAEAPVVKRFTQIYKMDVLGISLDGKPLPDFPDWKPDNGISMAITSGQGIDTVPAMFLVSRDQKTVVPIGSGSMSSEELADRIYTLMETTPGDGL
jgi:conjugal transfer pilus assembly protein TraF